MKNRLIHWILRVVPAVILLQTLYFKFTGAPESVFIFSSLGIEPYGRIGTGIAELVVSFLILVPRTTWIGAILGLGVISGAIFSHLFVLGIAVMHDGGYLFFLAVVVFVCCALLLVIERKKVPILRNF